MQQKNVLDDVCQVVRSCNFRGIKCQCAHHLKTNLHIENIPRGANQKIYRRDVFGDHNHNLDDPMEKAQDLCLASLEK